MYRGIFFGDFPRTDIPVGLNGANQYIFQATRRLNLNRFYATGVRLCGENEPVIVTIDQEVKRKQGWFYVGRITAVETPPPDERMPFIDIFAAACPDAYRYDEQPHDAAGGYDDGIADALRGLAALTDAQLADVIDRARQAAGLRVWLDEAAHIPDEAWKDIQQAVENPVAVAQKGEPVDVSVVAVRSDIEVPDILVVKSFSVIGDELAVCWLCELRPRLGAFQKIKPGLRFTVEVIFESKVVHPFHMEVIESTVLNGRRLWRCKGRAI